MTELETAIDERVDKTSPSNTRRIRRQLSEQVERLAAQYAQDQKRLTGQVERLEEDLNQFTRQYVKDQRLVVERKKADEAFDRAGRALRRGSEAARLAVKTGRKTKRAIAGASRGIGLAAYRAKQ